MDDTIKLLKECDAGTVMAVETIEQVMDNVKSDDLHELLERSVEKHKKLGNEIHEQLNEQGASGKEPSLMGRASAWITSEFKLMVEESDHQIAKLVMNGCNMGVQSLSEYMNKYEGASPKSMRLASSLVSEEQHLMDDLRSYL